MKPTTKQSIIHIVIILVFILLGFLFLLSFKRNERYIYYWDIAGYWTSGMDFTRLFFSDFAGAMARLYESILLDDYTLLPVLAYIPVFRWLSESNAAFVLATYIIYGVPFLLMLYVFLIRSFHIAALWVRAAVLFLLFTCTVFLTPLMGGFLDACGLTVIAGILLFLSYWDITKISPVKCLILAALILILCFLRRWYSFWAVSFFPAYFLALAVNNGRQGLKDKTTLKMLGNLVLSGVLWLLILFVFFREFLVRVFTNNFSFAYSAYDFGGIGYNLGFLAGQTGLYFMLLSAIGLILSLRAKAHRTHGLFFLLQAAICMLLFTRIQSLGVQHLYLFVPALLYFSVSAVTALPGLFGQRARAVVLAAVVLFAGLNFINSYVKHDNMILKATDPIFSEKKLYKRERADIDEIHRLISFINAASEKTKYVYLLSSSGILNSDILKNAYLPEIKYATKDLLYTYDVDKRDGFPDSFYTADFVIVTDPVQYHLAPSEQRIVGILADAILSGRAGDSLARVAEFSLEDGVTAYVYEKQKSYTHAFLREIDNRFKEAYPAHPFINNTLSIYAYLHDLDLSHGRNIHIQDKYTFGIDIGAEKTGFKLNLEHAFQTAAFSVKTPNESSAANTSVSIRNEKDEILSIKQLSPGETAVAIPAVDCESISIEFITDTANNTEASGLYAEIAFSLE